MKNVLVLSAWLALACGSVFGEEGDQPPAKGAKAGPVSPERALANKARDVLDRHCYSCHGGSDPRAPEMNVKLYSTVVGTSYEYVVPRDLEKSDVWQQLGEQKTMPPEGNPRPSDADVALIRSWIEKGAPEWDPLVEKRAFVSDVEVLAAIRDDLRQADEGDRTFRRYFSLANLHNNFASKRLGKTAPVAADVLNLARAALSKACNSMSMEKEIVVPKVIGKQGVVLRIDLRDLGWDKGGQWSTLLKSYPYGLKLHLDREQNVRELAKEVIDLSGSELPCVRLDWFIDTATRPKLYKQMLNLPAKVQDLEKKLGVDVENDFLRDRLARAGFSESGVSRSNRLVDRHPAVNGAYWKSYDFAKSEGKGNLFRAPLGPKFKDNPFERGNDRDPVFEHDGGEMIFNLPNGLQGYYLSKANGEELEDGPIQIVRDIQEWSGTPVVVNGLSCMACHKNGPRRFVDTIRKGLAVEGEARLKVDRLFKEKERMDELLDKDEARFLAAAAEAMAPFLNPDDPKSITPEKLGKNFAEPIGLVAKMYQKDLSVEEAAFELGYDDAEKLRILIEGNSRLRQLGLGPLVNGAAIKREAWVATKGLSTFQKAALELDRGTPHREL